MTARKPRGLHPEERELWDKVRQNTVPLHRPQKEVILEVVKEISSPPPPPRPEIPTFRVGQNSTFTKTRPPASSATALQMDSKKFGRMKKGKLLPEARIDLHGMTLAEAHPALIGFILNAQGGGKRLVLVITGKGRPKSDSGPIPNRPGILRHQVPQWLRQGALAGVVQQVAESHFRHGGGGALYVYLRRRR